MTWYVWEAGRIPNSCVEMEGTHESQSGSGDEGGLVVRSEYLCSAQHNLIVY